MRFTIFLISACLFTLSMVQLSTAQASLLPTTSTCTTECANKAAVAIGCKDFSDLGCYCGNQKFMIANAKCSLAACPAEILNATQVQASFSQLEMLCRLANGHFGLHIPTLAELGLANSTTSSASSNTSTDSSSSLSSPFISHLVPTAFIVSLILGALTLLS